MEATTVLIVVVDQRMTLTNRNGDASEDVFVGLSTSASYTNFALKGSNGGSSMGV